MSDKGSDPKPEDQGSVPKPQVDTVEPVAAAPQPLPQQPPASHTPTVSTQPAPADPKPTWWQENWDKVFGIVMSLVVGGVAGFFAAILAIQQDVHDISTRVNTLETTASTAWQPRLDKVDPMEQKLQDIERIMRELERSDEAEALLRERIQQIIEDTRKRTAEELREILEANP